jgi:phosphatidylglycerol:prolipoprotein diacylglycerol transferase
MIPYIHVPDFHIGPLPLHPFGILVATGVLTGTSVTAKRGEKLGYDVVRLNSFITWMLVSAFVLSHALDAIFYHWHDELERMPWSINPLSDSMPWYLIKPWLGLSSFGGFVGAVVGIVLWRYLEIVDGKLRVRRRPAALLAYADLVLSVLPLGWLFGRLGCSIVHDHPGARATADTLLAVAYPMPDPSRSNYVPAGTSVTRLGPIELFHGNYPRFDLGTLEFIFTAVLITCFAITWSRRVPIGTYAIATGLSYAPVRFAMDFLRVPDTQGGDPRYGALTPAQWCCFALFAFSVVMIFYVRSLKKRGIDPATPVMAEALPEKESPTGDPRQSSSP